MLFLKNDKLKVVKLNLLKMGRPITMAHQSREEKEDNCNEVDEVFYPDLSSQIILISSDVMMSLEDILFIINGF